MSKRIIPIALAIVVVLLGWYAWERHSQDLALDNGTVTSADVPATDKQAMDSGEVDIDGRPMSETDGSGSASGSTGAEVAATGPVMSNPAVRTLPNATPAPQMAQGIMAAQQAETASAVPASAPTSDTLAANPPAGMAFGGSGKFQWYRQGDITWRLNTQSGFTCIAFATMDEWAKPLVYTHGCGNG